MTLNIPNRDHTAGIAGGWVEDIAPNADPFVTGHVPAVFTTDELVAASQNIPARTPVRFSSGALVPAVQGQAACGILVYAVATGAGDTTVRAGVYRGGVFNPDQINWPASYDTEEKKRLAFEGAPSPTAIVIRKPQTMTV